MKSFISKCLIINAVIIIIAFIMDAFDVLAKMNIHLISMMNFGVWQIIAIVCTAVSLYCITMKTIEEKNRTVYENRKAAADYLLSVLYDEYLRGIDLIKSGKAIKNESSYAGFIAPVDRLYDTLQPYIIEGILDQSLVKEIIRTNANYQSFVSFAINNLDRPESIAALQERLKKDITASMEKFNIAKAER